MLRSPKVSHAHTKGDAYKSTICKYEQYLWCGKGLGITKDEGVKRRFDGLWAKHAWDTFGCSYLQIVDLYVHPICNQRAKFYLSKTYAHTRGVTSGVGRGLI